LQTEISDGDTIGEIGVLYNRPQPFTVRTKNLSQILRLSRTSLMNALHANPEAAPIIMTNLFMVIYISLFCRLNYHITPSHKIYLFLLILLLSIADRKKLQFVQILPRYSRNLTTVKRNAYSETIFLEL
jgi:hypothetical protein